MSEQLALIHYDAACKALAEARSIDDAKDIRDKAEAVRAYAKQSKNKKLELDAAEIRMRAERRLGELLAKTDKAPGAREPKALRETPRQNAVATDDRVGPATLEELGISKDLSAKSQRLAAVPSEVFESKLGELRRKVEEEGERVTTDLLKIGADQQKQPDPKPTDCRIEVMLSLPLAEWQVWSDAAKKENLILTEWIRGQVNWGLPTEASTIDIKPTPKAPTHSDIQKSTVDLKATPWMVQTSETRRHLQQFTEARCRRPETVAEWDYFLRKG
jgi:hypothetical protein